MKALTPDCEWSVQVFLGTPQAMRFIVEPGEMVPTHANTRQYAFQDEAVLALVAKGYTATVAEEVVGLAISKFRELSQGKELGAVEG